MPSNNSKYIDSRFDRLSEENAELRREVQNLKESLATLKSEMEGLQFVVSENVMRRECAENDLSTLHSKCSSLEGKVTTVQSQCEGIRGSQGRLASAVEVQAQYSRRSTLLLSGSAVPAYQPGEDTLSGSLRIIKDYLGIQIHPLAISACHRLRNRNVILLRFLNYAERDSVYRRRIKPLKGGLSVHESLTAERLAVVKIIRSLHYPKEGSPLDTFYTSQGNIFIKPRGCQRAIEVKVGASKEDILSLVRSGAPAERSPASVPGVLGGGATTSGGGVGAGSLSRSSVGTESLAVSASGEAAVSGANASALGAAVSGAGALPVRPGHGDDVPLSQGWRSLDVGEGAPVVVGDGGRRDGLVLGSVAGEVGLATPVSVPVETGPGRGSPPLPCIGVLSIPTASGAEAGGVEAPVPSPTQGDVSRGSGPVAMDPLPVIAGVGADISLGAHPDPEAVIDPAPMAGTLSVAPCTVGEPGTNQVAPGEIARSRSGRPVRPPPHRSDT